MQQGVLGPRLKKSEFCDVPKKLLTQNYSDVPDSEPDDGVNMTGPLRSRETGFSFKTKVLNTDSFLSNLSYPISLGLNYH